MSVEQTGGQTSTDTNNGFIVGVEPAKPQMAADWNSTIETAVSTSQAAPATIAEPIQQNPATSAFYTDADLQRVRKEEKDKLYGRLSGMEDELKLFKTDREDRAAREKESHDAELAERTKKEESEMELRDLLNKKEQEWQSKLDEYQAENERNLALFERERELQEVEEYRRNRLEQEAESIIPQLRDLVRGDTQEQVENSILELKARSEQIMQDVAEATQQQRPQMRGPATTAPPVGPMENQPLQQTFSPENIRNMSMDEYRRHRESLLSAARPGR